LIRAFGGGADGSGIASQYVPETTKTTGKIMSLAVFIKSNRAQPLLATICRLTGRCQFNLTYIRRTERGAHRSGVQTIHRNDFDQSAWNPRPMPDLPGVENNPF